MSSLLLGIVYSLTQFIDTNIYIRMSVCDLYTTQDGQLMVTGDRNRSMNLVDLNKWDEAGDRNVVMKDMLVHTALSHGVSSEFYQNPSALIPKYCRK